MKKPPLRHSALEETRLPPTLVARRACREPAGISLRACARCVEEGVQARKRKKAEGDKTALPPLPPLDGGQKPLYPSEAHFPPRREALFFLYPLSRGGRGGWFQGGGMTSEAAFSTPPHMLPARRDETAALRFEKQRCGIRNRRTETTRRKTGRRL